MSLLQKILVVDDEHSVRWAFEKALQKAGYQVALAETGTKGLETFETLNPDLTILDIRMPGMDGLKVLKCIREKSPNAQVIIMTAYGDMETTISAMKLGAYDFLPKPFNIVDCLTLIQRALAAREIGKNMVPAEVPEKTNFLIGNSSVMHEVYKLIGKVSAEDVTVLITGESGAGKELVAQAIHYNSNRSQKPFWAINCTAISESLMESELFGHEKGAFTGASQMKIGTFELAQGGTLFLDEIGDMSLELQSKILRVLEEREIIRVGGTHKVKVDVRIIAATNKDLRKAIQENRFREDLFHRIKVIEIQLPPLRHRPDDIPILANYFISQISINRKGFLKSLTDEALYFLRSYSWPGNVRELRNSIERAYTISRDQVILPEHLPSEIRLFGQTKVEASNNSTFPVSNSATPQNLHPVIENKGIPPINAPPTAFASSLSSGDLINSYIRSCFKENISGNAYDKVMDIVEKELLAQALEIHKGNQVQTAIFLGITRNTLRAKIEKFSL